MTGEVRAAQAAGEANTMNAAFVGRQPIYSPDCEVAAYEVLFRDGSENAAVIDDGDQATVQLVLNLVAEIGFEQVVGSYPAYINTTRNFIVEGHAYALPSDRVVLEVLENIAPEPDVIAALQALSDEGFTIALDDFVYTPELQPFLEVADIVKVELPAISKEDLPHHVDVLRKRDVKLLAEKVESYEAFERCKSLGFDLFQGYFFCRPRVIQGARVPINRVAALQLLRQLRSADVVLSDLTQILSTEPSLCYKLLRFVNSASCGLRRHIDSIQAAISVIGFQRLQTFASLALLARVAEDKPPHLIVTALTRARMCELLAERLNRPRTEMYFIAGLFSVLDALLDLPMADALASLPLESEIQAALLGQAGPVAEIVGCVVNYDRTEFDNVRLAGVDRHGIRTCYLDALAWAATASSAAARLA